MRWLLLLVVLLAGCCDDVLGHSCAGICYETTALCTINGVTLPCVIRVRGERQLQAWADRAEVQPTKEVAARYKAAGLVPEPGYRWEVHKVKEE